MHVDSTVGRTYQYWIASTAFFDTALVIYPVYISPDFNPQVSNSDRTIAVSFFDCDGEEVNKAVYTIEHSRVTVLELSVLMEGFKYEGGFKHGIISVKASPGIEVKCRIYSHSSATFLNPLPEIYRHQREFLPVRFSPDTKTLVVLANLTKDSNQVRAKLFLGKRSPESIFTIPSAGVRLICLEQDFAECFEGKSSSSLGYVRFSSKNDLPFAVQVIECGEGKREQAFLSSIL